MATRIPDMWLCGATQAWMRRGLDEREALRAAILWWHEQERLAAQFERDRQGG